MFDTSLYLMGNLTPRLRMYTHQGHVSISTCVRKSFISLWVLLHYICMSTSRCKPVCKIQGNHLRYSDMHQPCCCRSLAIIVDSMLTTSSMIHKELNAWVTTHGGSPPSQLVVSIHSMRFNAIIRWAKIHHVSVFCIADEDRKQMTASFRRTSTHVITFAHKMSLTRYAFVDAINSSRKRVQHVLVNHVAKKPSVRTSTSH